MKDLFAIIAGYLIFFSVAYWCYYLSLPKPKTSNNEINTECTKGSRYVIVDDKKIRLKKFDKNALNQVSDIYCVR